MVIVIGLLLTEDDDNIKKPWGYSFVFNVNVT